jgi:SPP1 family predicted phage head-tail adaptor
MTIFAGTLTSRLDFYHIVETQGQSGFKTVEEQKYMRCFADRMKNKESYAVDADELFHLTELTFKIRYRKEIKETDIVVYRNERYRITSIDELPQDNEMTIKIAKIND